MNLLDVSEFYAERGGGVRTYVHQKLDAAASLGVHLTVVAPGPEDRVELRHGGQIIWIKGPPMPLDPRYYLLLRERAVHQVIDDVQPDIIEGSSPWTGGWFAARYQHQHQQHPKKASPKKAFIFHQDPVAVYPHTLLDSVLPRATIDNLCRPYWAYLRRLSQHFDRTIVAGQWLADRLLSFGMPNAHAVPFGIAKARFSPTLRDETLRTEMLANVGLSPEDFLCIGVSRHHPEKRIFTMLNAMKQLQHKRVGLVLYGDGPLRPLVDHHAAQLPNVHIAGFTSHPEDLPKALASADAFLHGSAAETYGLVLAEALCSGLPLIVPNAGGARDFALPDMAESYAPGDATECANAIQRLVCNNYKARRDAVFKKRDTMVHNVEEHFSKLFETYEALLTDADSCLQSEVSNSASAPRLPKFE